MSSRGVRREWPDRPPRCNHISALTHPTLLKRGAILERPDVPNHDRIIRRNFWAAATLVIVLALISFFSVRAVIARISGVAFRDAVEMIEIQQLRLSTERKGRIARSFLVTGNERSLAEMRAADELISARLARLQGSALSRAERELLDAFAEADRAYQRSLDRTIALRLDGATSEAVARYFEAEVQPARDELDKAMMNLAELQELQLEAATGAARRTVSHTLKLLMGVAGVGLIATAVLGVKLTRALRALHAQSEELTERAATIEGVNRELDAFAGRVSHDLRNLLTPIGLAAATLHRSSSEPLAIAPIAERIQRSVSRSVAMLDGLLAFSRSARPEPSASSSITAAIQEVLDQVTPLATQVGASVESSLDDIEVACSRELLIVVALNLVGNAVKFLDGRDTRWVRVSARRVEESCELVFEDSGPGIPEDALGRIFDPFYRVPGTRAAGVGIGLATVRRIVDAHRGQITVRSILGQGTTLRVSLPLARPAGAAG